MRYFIITILAVFSAVQVNAQQERKFIRKGNTEFTDEKYLESEIEYRKALDKEKSSFEGQFNLGDALYKQEKYDEALTQFQVLAGTEKDPNKLAQVYHNIGNSYMALGKIPEAIEAYKDGLRNNPLDNNTRYNLIAAQKMLQQQQNQNQQNQDQQQNQQNQDQQQQNQDSDGDGIPDQKEQQNDQGQQNKNQDTDNDGIPDYKDQDSDNDGRPDKQEAGADPSNPQDTDKDGTPDYRDLDSDNDGTPDKDEKQDQNQNQQQQQQPNQQQQQQQNEMSKEDAMRLLNAIEQDESELQKKLRKVKATRSKTEKNW